MPSTAATQQRALRSRAVLQGASFGIVTRAISIVCTLVQVPVALHYLGPEGFGLWMTLTSIASLLTLGDFGLGLGAKTLLVRIHGKDDPLALRAMAKECLRQILPLALTLVGAGILLAWLLPWPRFLGIGSTALAANLPWAFTGLAVVAGATLITSVGGSLAAAVQLTRLHHLANAFGGALTLVVVVACSALNASWLTFVLAALALPVLVNLFLGWAVHRHLAWSGPPPSRPDAALRAELRQLGRWFFIPQAGSLFAILSVPVIISGIGGPTAVTAFNLLQRVFGLVGQMHWMSLAALWPAYGEAHTRRDFDWMRRAYRQSWVVTLLVFVPGLVLLGFLTPSLVRFWVGWVPAEITPRLIAVSAFWFGLQLLGQPPALLLNGLGQIRGVAIYGTAGHLLSCLGMVIGGPLAGTPGVVAGMAAGYLLVGLPGALLESRRALRGLAA